MYSEMDFLDQMVGVFLISQNSIFKTECFHGGYVILTSANSAQCFSFSTTLFPDLLFVGVRVVCFVFIVAMLRCARSSLLHSLFIF